MEQHGSQQAQIFAERNELIPHGRIVLPEDLPHNRLDEAGTFSLTWDGVSYLKNRLGEVLSPAMLYGVPGKVVVDDAPENRLAPADRIEAAMLYANG